MRITRSRPRRTHFWVKQGWGGENEKKKLGFLNLKLKWLGEFLEGGLRRTRPVERERERERERESCESDTQKPFANLIKLYNFHWRFL